MRRETEFDSQTDVLHRHERAKPSSISNREPQFPRQMDFPVHIQPLVLPPLRVMILDVTLYAVFFAVTREWLVVWLAALGIVYGLTAGVIVWDNWRRGWAGEFTGLVAFFTLIAVLFFIAAVVTSQGGG